MKTLERASDALLDKDWGAKIPDYITKGTFSVAVFFMSLTMRGETHKFFDSNKTKYFRLRLTDEVSSERPVRDLRETWD